MSSSAEISRQIYAQLRPDGLASRTAPQWDQRTVDLVMSMLTPGQNVLDVGCGYGRIAVPLASAGFEVVGLDISEVMLAAAQSRAERAGVTIRWIRGDMCQLPIEDASFDVVLCLWLTFHELLERSEQLVALREMYRVLRPGGRALLDGPPYPTDSDQHDGLNDVLGTDNQFIADKNPDMKGYDGQHDSAAFKRLIREVPIEDYTMFVDDCPGRPRLFLRFVKS